MATNNAINVTSSGIVSYDGSGSFSSAGNPLTVSNGGFGVSSNNSYSILCAGTSSTSAIQSLSSNGINGQILISNGSSTLPSFQSRVGTYLLPINTSGPVTGPSDNTTYFMRQAAQFNASTTASATSQRLYIAKNGTCYGCGGIIWVAGTLASSENVTVAIRLNNSTDTTITSTLQLTSIINTFNVTNLNISVSAGDYFEIKVSCPTWATNPTGVSASMSIYLI